MENTPPRWSHVESIRTKHHALMIDISHFMPELDG
jgi:hypothetical protein